MAFRNRGQSISVDTTNAAELDILLYEVPSSVVERIAASLENLPVSRYDEINGVLHRREFDEFSAYFIHATEQNGGPLIYLLAVCPTEKSSLKMRDIMNIIAALRGATGV